MEKELAVIMALLFISGMFLGIGIERTKNLVMEVSIGPTVSTNITTETPKAVKEVSELEGISKSQITVVGVDQEGNGVTATLKVSVMPGDGEVLANIEDLFFWVDTQYSMRTAKDVAEDYLNLEDNYDFVYSVDSDAYIIGGPSAGAAITLATIAALENKNLPEDVSITGAINSDGAILPVGEIIPKAQAAKDVGMTKFVIPKGQGTQTYFERQQTCDRVGSFQLCRTNYVPKKVDVEEFVGIDILEVRDIEEAAEVFGV